MSKLTVISFQSLRSSSMTKKSILSKSNATSNRYRRTKLFQMMLTMMYWLRLRRHVRHSSTNHPNSGILFEKVTKSMRSGVPFIVFWSAKTSVWLTSFPFLLDTVTSVALDSTTFSSSSEEGKWGTTICISMLS